MFRWQMVVGSLSSPRRQATGPVTRSRREAGALAGSIETFDWRSRALRAP
jgi:hypothetical protein